MIVTPFQVGIFNIIDYQELSGRERLRVGRALRSAFNIMPREFQCDRGRPSLVDNAFPIMRFGIFFNTELVGAIWLGCTVLAPGHTARNAQVFVRPSPGFIADQTDRFWKAGVFLEVIKFLLDNQLVARTGETIQVVGLEYVRDSRIIPREFAQIHTALNTLLKSDSSLVLETRALTRGGEDVRIVKAPVRRRSTP